MPQKQDLQPLLEVRQNQLSLIFSASDSLDTKNLALLAINVGVLLFIAQLDLSHSLTIAVFSTFAISSMINIASILPRKYTGASVEIEEYPEYLSMAEDDLVLQLIADTQVSISHNTRLNAIKLRLCSGSILVSVIGASLLVWGIL